MSEFFKMIVPDNIGDPAGPRRATGAAPFPPIAIYCRHAPPLP